MPAYFDTSALVKRYITEDGTPAVCACWDAADVAVSCWLLYPEMIATFARKRREAVIATALIDTAEAAFRRDWFTLARVACDDDLIRRVDALHVRHALRGADSTHLAAALKYRDLCGEPLIFVCADVQLRTAALTEGLALVPGAAFGDDRWVRLSYAASDEALQGGMDRLVRHFQRLRGEAEPSKLEKLAR